MNRAEVLKKAERITTGEREQAYGSPEDNFTMIAGMWSAYLQTPITPEDVATMMILLKTARVKSGHGSDDNWVDIAGYAACGAEIQSKDPEVMRWSE